MADEEIKNPPAKINPLDPAVRTSWRTFEYPTGIRSFSHIELVAAKYKMPMANNAPSTGFEIGDWLGTFLLYVPSGVIDNYEIEWGIEQVPYTARQLIGSGGDVSADTLKAFGSDVLAKLGQTGPGRQASRVAGFGYGKTMLPNSVLVLEGASHFSLQLQWELAPQTKEEGDTVKSMITFLRRYAVPSATMIGNIRMMAYPALWFLRVNTGTMSKVSKSRDNQKLFSYDNMVISGFSVSYSPNTNTVLTYDDGNPVQANLSINFRSIMPGMRFDEVPPEVTASESEG